MCVLIYNLILAATLKRTVYLTIQQIKLQFADWDSCTNSYFAVAELCMLLMGKASKAGERIKEQVLRGGAEGAGVV